MVSDHPTPEELEDLLYGGLPEESTVAAVRHLFKCQTCRAAVAPRAVDLFTAPHEPEPQEDTAYDRALDRAFAAVREAAADPRGIDPRRLQGLEGYRALLARSWSMRREDPRQMVELARRTGAPRPGSSWPTASAPPTTTAAPTRAWPKLPATWRRGPAASGCAPASSTSRPRWRGTAASSKRPSRPWIRWPRSTSATATSTWRAAPW